MKRIMLIAGYALAILCLAVQLPAKTTAIKDVWKDKEFGGKVNKIAVFWIDNDRARRIIIENEFVRQLKARGVDAMPVYVVIPPDKMVDKEEALEKIRNLGIQAILMARLIDKPTAESAIPEPGQKDASGWAGYYHYVYDPITRDQNAPAAIETTLFDAITAKRVWIARSVSKIQAGDMDGASMVIESLIDRLAADKMIK